jgi:hypothetical protein
MYMRLRNINKLSDNEQGFASIVIALVLIIVLALLTVGFAQLARREQQDALDSQLSSQAFYAAESGINDATKDIQSGAICDSSISSTCASTDASSTNCMTTPGSPSGGTQTLPNTALTASPNVNTSDDVSYSCLLVNLQPSSVVFDDTPPASGQYLDFSTTQPLKSLTIQWGSYDGNNTNFPLSSTYPTQGFPNQTTWDAQDYPPVLAFSLTPATVGGVISRSALISSTFNVYMYPAHDTFGGYAAGPAPGNSTEVNYSPGTQAPIVSGNCGDDSSANYPCSVTITGLGGINPASYLLYYTPFYDAANVYVTGTDTSNQPIDFIGQAQIDVTGKAQNVEKRLQVRLDANGQNGMVTDPSILPNSSVEGQNICKREQTGPITVTNPNGTNFIAPTGGTVDLPTNDPCDLDY